MNNLPTKNTLDLNLNLDPKNQNINKQFANN